MNEQRHFVRFLRPLLSILGAAGWPWRILTARRAVGRAAAGVAPARAALQRFDECSAREFDTLAAGLNRFNGQLALVRDQSALLESTLQDHDEDHALLSAFTLYKKSVDLAHASIGIALTQEEEMEHMEGGLLGQQAAFTRTNFMFRVIVMNLRAEAARIDPEHRAVFISVASEMARMEQRRSATLDTAFTQLETIVADASAGRVELQGLRDQLHTDAQASIRVLRTEFDGITERLKPCLSASREILRLLGAAQGHAGELITSLQVRDRVRQQLDHVGEGWAGLAAHLAPAGANTRMDSGSLAQAVRRQQRNLESSHHAIDHAAQRIVSGGAGLLGTGAGLAGRCGEMEREVARIFQGSRLGDLFQRETAKLVATAAQSEATNDRITTLVGRIEQSVGVFSSELKQQELDVHLVALNAQVAAARLPEARALNKLAEETSLLARESAALSRTMSTELSATLARLNNMRREGDEVRLTIGREKADLAQGSVIVSEKLTRFNERVSRISAEIGEKNSAAYQHLQGLLGSLQFPETVHAAFAPAEELCARLAAATGGFLAAYSHAALAGHHEHSTKHQERAAHAAALGREVVAEQVDAVEFFGDAPDANPATVAAAGDIELF